MAEESWTRADWARWFVHQDDADEAARVVEPGDVIPLGESDSANLAAALERRGLAARYDGEGHLAVLRPAEGARKPPARAPAGPAPSIKKTA
jgi:hypothetical protein